MAPRTEGKTSSTFPGWDELVAEATRTAETAGSMESYELPLGENDVVYIERFDGDRYLDFIDAQRRGDSATLMEAMFPDKAVRDRVRIKMRGAPFEIVDVLGAKVIRHFYGLSIETEERSGNSDAS
jgi:hypothetical protein